MKKKLFAATFAILMITFIILSANAAMDSAVTADPDSACPKTLYNLVAAENSQDWDAFCSMFTKDQIEREKEYFKSGQKTGVKSVKSAKLVEIQSLDSKNSITKAASDSRSYIIGVDYTVTREDKYYINGVNYHLIMLQLEENEWKILEYQDAPLEVFITDNKVDNETRADAIVKALPNLNPKNVKTTLDILDARAAGIIINAKGEFLGSNNENVKSAEDARELLESIKAERAAGQP